MTAMRALLRESLPLARRLAKTHCCHIDDSGTSCAAFHGIWQVLRYLELNTTPTEHDRFFMDRMAPAIHAGARKVLITGTADYAMVDVVRRAFIENNAIPEITVVDVCDTPLRLCQWYADKAGLPLSVRCEDILTYSDPTPYDLVCTHSFLGLFTAANRRRLASKWHDLLRPGGSVLSVNRVRPGAAERVSFGAKETEIFLDQVGERLRSSDLAAAIDPAEIAVLARQYIQHRVVYPIRSEEEIADLLTGAGFSVAHLQSEVLAEDRPDRPAGPTLRGGARYACFVGRR